MPFLFLKYFQRHLIYSVVDLGKVPYIIAGPRYISWNAGEVRFATSSWVVLCMAKAFGSTSVLFSFFGSKEDQAGIHAVA
jgi:hypothetical protein